MKTNNKISITIPAYNEEQTIKNVIINALESVKKITSSFEILLVDDGSTDNTRNIIEELKNKYPDKIRIIYHKNNKGFSGAMTSCFKNANGDLIFLGPADGQFNYEEVKKFAKEIRNKDIIVAYRAVNNENLFRKFNSFVFHLIVRILLGIRLREFSSCIMYKKEVRDSIKITANPFSCLFLPEFIYKATKKKYRFGEVPIHFYKRKGGSAKGTNVKMMIKTLLELLRFSIDIQLGKVK